MRADEVLQWWQSMDPWEREAIDQVYGGDRIQAYETTRRFQQYLLEQVHDEIQSLEAILETCPA